MTSPAPAEDEVPVPDDAYVASPEGAQDAPHGPGEGKVGKKSIPHVWVPIHRVSFAPPVEPVAGLFHRSLTANVGGYKQGKGVVTDCALVEAVHADPNEIALILDEEGTGDEWAGRTISLIKGMGYDDRMLDRIRYIDMEANGRGGDIVRHLDWCIAQVESAKATLVIIDSATAALEGRYSENDVGAAYSRFTRRLSGGVRKVTTLMHTPNDQTVQRAIGGQSLIAGVRLQNIIQNKGDHFIVKRRNRNDGRAGAEQRYDVTWDEWSGLPLSFTRRPVLTESKGETPADSAPPRWRHIIDILQSRGWQSRVSLIRTLGLEKRTDPDAALRDVVRTAKSKTGTSIEYMNDGYHIPGYRGHAETEEDEA